jgi:hypothetical protein
MNTFLLGAALVSGSRPTNHSTLEHSSRCSKQGNYLPILVLLSSASSLCLELCMPENSLSYFERLPLIQNPNLACMPTGFGLEEQVKGRQWPRTRRVEQALDAFSNARRHPIEHQDSSESRLFGSVLTELSGLTELVSNPNQRFERSSNRHEGYRFPARQVTSRLMKPSSLGGLTDPDSLSPRKS